MELLNVEFSLRWAGVQRKQWNATVIATNDQTTAKPDSVHTYLRHHGKHGAEDVICPRTQSPIWQTYIEADLAETAKHCEKKRPCGNRCSESSLDR